MDTQVKIPVKCTIRRRGLTGDPIGEPVTRLVNPADKAALDEILIRAVTDDGWDPARVVEFEMIVDPAEGKRFTWPADD